MTENKRGFTMVELLLVCVIIGAVASIVFSAFWKPKQEKARQTSCLSNMKLISLGFQQYAQDYDLTMPGYQFHPRRAPTDTVNGTGWAGQIWNYLPEPQVFHCPSDRSNGLTFSGKTVSSISYAFNSNATGQRQENFNSPVRTVMLFEVNSVAAQVQVHDEGRSSGASQLSAAGNGVNGRLSSSLTELPALTDPVRYATGELDNSRPNGPISFDQYSGQEPRHTGGSNFLLSDGHSSWQRPAAISAGGNALKMGNPQSATGCPPDGSKHPGTYPCAAATDNNATPPYGATFSVN